MTTRVGGVQQNCLCHWLGIMSIIEGCLLRGVTHYSLLTLRDPDRSQIEHGLRYG